MKYFLGLPLVLLALQLQIPPLPAAGPASSPLLNAAQFLPSTSSAIAYQYPTSVVPLYLLAPPSATMLADSSAHRAGTQPSAALQAATSAPADFSDFMQQAFNELDQAWFSIRALFR